MLRGVKGGLYLCCLVHAQTAGGARVSLLDLGQCNTACCPLILTVGGAIVAKRHRLAAAAATRRAAAATCQLLELAGERDAPSLVLASHLERDILYMSGFQTSTSLHTDLK